VSQLAAVVDGKGVCPWRLTPACPSAISASDFGEQDEELHGQLVEKQGVEEGVVLLAPGVEEQHLDKRLLQLLVGQQRWLVELFHPLNIRQLMHSQEAVTELHVRVRRERDSLHQVGDENYHRIRDACNQLKKRNSSYAMFHSPKEP
jgi:hypothetical protein